MPDSVMHWFMKLGDSWYKHHIVLQFDLLWPIFIDPFEKVYEPLTHYVVAGENEVDHDELKCGTKDVVHIRVPAPYSALFESIYRNWNIPFSLL